MAVWILGAIELEAKAFSGSDVDCGFRGNPVGTAIDGTLGSTGLGDLYPWGSEVKGGIVGNCVRTAVVWILGTTGLEVGVAS